MEQATHHVEFDRCANCGSPRADRFCATCGQNDRDFRRSLPPVISDLLREAFELDGRLIQSFKLLVLKPGQLSLEFSNNRRSSFVSPVRLYLFTSILFFFVLSATTNIGESLAIEVHDAAVAVDDDADATQRFLGSLNDEQRIKAERGLAKPGSIARSGLLALSESYSEQVESGVEFGRVERFVYHRVVDALTEPQRMLTQAVDNIPVAFFFLVPFCALLLKIIFWSSRRYYVEHLVFTLHLFSVSFLFYTAAILLPDSEPTPIDVGDGTAAAATIVDALQMDQSAEVIAVETTQSSNDVLWSTVSWALFVLFLWYYYRSLRRYYGRGRLSTLLRFALLNGFYLAMLAPTVALVMIATVTFL